jgi:hypothetical protein
VYGLITLVINHAVHIVFSSTALDFLTNMSEKRESALPSAIQVKNRGKTICIEEKFDVMCRLVKGERIAHMSCNFRLAYSSVHTIRDNADGIKESTKSGTKVFVCVARLPQSYPNERNKKKYGCESVIFLLHQKQINILYRNVFVLYRIVYILYTQYVHTPQVRMSTSGIVIHYRG